MLSILLFFHYRIAPAVLRQATYGTIKFGIYYTLKQMLTKNPNEERLGINVFCAVTAGIQTIFFISFVENPHITSLMVLVK